MANVFGEFVLALIRSIVANWVFWLWVKLAAWLDPGIRQHWMKVAVGGLIGLIVYFMIPIVIWLLGL